ncbi:hypothetical protein E4P39_08495 [Blastococcus sp. CT_GayMR19]|uniref:hypothetical protein n=1 Tax=Blastococcus sp. CT_GayMR19 TaxID=2559608 RepID=UPI00107425F4|nr:hypothetical protein [Blastococcus sp. CT_GayMR19]TFV76913.1 hypothetical protein E4P39_08495 [Blastococcus sp. CT_GayMR19]
MTVVVPDPIPLEMPPGDPAALEDFVEDVAGTAYRLAVVRTCLTSSAATAPNWRGADASAATAQVGVVAALAEELSGGVAAAAHRLRAHHDLLTSTRQRVTVLRSQQDEDFLIARARLREIPDFLTAVPPEAAAVAEELAIAEAARRREHDRLLAEVADDAAAAARALAEASAIVGGSGRSGDDGRVIAHLAAELPGWGDAELRRRGAVLARALAGGPVTPGEVAVLAGSALAYAGSATFARALFTGLGVDGVRGLLASLGYNAHGDSSDLAQVLAAAFGAAVPNGRDDDPVAEVLTATYVAVDDRFGDPDVAAAGLAAVLLVAVDGPRAGSPRPETVAAWSRQLLERERAQDLPAGAGAVPLDWDPRALDPVELAFSVLVAGGESGPAAGLLADRDVWDTVLSRFWGDGGAALGAVVALAGAEPGPAGHGAVRMGLERLAAGLSDEGDPAKWTVRPEIAAAISRSLAQGAAAHLSVITDVLQAAVGGGLRGSEEDVLRGLGYLTLDRGAAVIVESALLDEVRAELLAQDGAGVDRPLPAVAAAGAYGAVQHYGQRLAHAIHGFEAQDAAERAEAWWTWTWGLAANLVLGRFGPAAGLVEGYAAILVGSDGTWENGTDRGKRLDRGDAEDMVLAQLSPHGVAAALEVADEAGTAYVRTAESLGSPKPPASPPPDWLKPLVDALADQAIGKAVDESGVVRALRKRFGLSD